MKKRFTAAIDARGKGVLVRVPFDPDEVWGRKPKHHVSGRLGDCGVRAVLERDAGGWVFRLGPAWLRGSGVAVGDKVKVELAPEGPQRDGLAPDLAAALDAEPKAGEFFDSIAQFYRKAYIRWIDATTKRPDVRAQRIAETVKLLKAGIKERPGR
jgi:hypothetical protein